MATRPIPDPLPDPIEEEAKHVFADPGVRASIERFHRELESGQLGHTYTTPEAIERLGLDPDELLDE